MIANTEIKIAECSDDDIAESFAAMSDGFRHDAPFLDAYFPKHDTPDGSAAGAKRLLAWKQAAPDSTFLKAVLGDKIIGIAVWTLMKAAPSPDITEYEDVQANWPNEDDQEFMKQLWASYVVPRGRAVNESGNKGIYVLELLAVRRDHHQQGAGTALVRWGTNAADKLGVDSVVEGTPAGRRTYEKGGFRAEIEEMKFDIDERFNARRKPVLIFLKWQYRG